MYKKNYFRLAFVLLLFFEHKKSINRTLYILFCYFNRIAQKVGNDRKIKEQTKKYGKFNQNEFRFHFHSFNQALLKVLILRLIALYKKAFNSTVFRNFFLFTYSRYESQKASIIVRNYNRRSFFQAKRNGILRTTTAKRVASFQILSV